MNKYLIAALGAGTMLTIAAPASAQTVTGTVNITGSVANKCAVIPGSGSTFTSTVALGELAQADGTMATDLATRFNASGPATLAFRVVCNTSNPTIAVDSTQLTTSGAASTGYAARIDYNANVAVALSPSGSTTVSNDSRNAPTAATPAGGPLANTGGANVTITADTFGTASPTDLLVAGSYTGNISIVIAPGA
jgi:hypothetical protein